MKRGGEKNDPLPQKGRRTAKKICMGSGQILPKGKKFTGGCPGKVSNGDAGRPR